MNNVVKNVIKSIIFGVIFILLFELFSYLLLPQKGYVNKFGIINTSSHEILGEKENTVDVIFLGDSLVYSAISPMEIWHDYGYTSYDIANAAQIISDTYDNLKFIVASQSPQVVFVEADVLFRDPQNRPWYYDSKKMITKYIPIMNYHDNWKKYLFNFLNNDDKFDTVNYSKGFKYLTGVLPAKKKNYMKPNNKKRKIPQDNLIYIEKIVDLCKDNDIELIFMSNPNMRTWNYAKHSTVKNLASKYGVEFLDLNLEPALDIDWKTETRDKGRHLNYQGAVKVSKFLGQYLQDMGIVVDHRSDDNYREWNYCYKVYKSKQDL